MCRELSLNYYLLSIILIIIVMNFVLFLYSTINTKMNFLYILVGTICAVSFLLVQIGIIFLVIKYRKREGKANKRSFVTDNKKLEIMWTVVPSIILFILFIPGAKFFYDIRTMPENAMEIEIKARQWSWDYIYPQVTPAILKNSRNYCLTPVSYQGNIPGTPVDCKKSEMEWKLGEPLRVPVNTKVILKMTSNDVIHSFYIPAFNLKQDVLPGQYSYLWFEATQEGTYDVYCAEYCGTDHSGMISRVEVMGQKDFSAWLYSGADTSDGAGKELSTEELIQKGSELYQSKGCVACHRIDGKNAVGPYLNNKYNQKEILTDGTEVLVDENYLVESIIQPNAKVVKGFAPSMPLQNVNKQEIKSIIEFIKSLK